MRNSNSYSFLTVNNTFQSPKCLRILTWTSTRGTTRRRRRTTPKVGMDGELCLGSLWFSQLYLILSLLEFFWSNRMHTQSSIKVSFKDNIFCFLFQMQTKLSMKYFYTQNVILFPICHFSFIKGNKSVEKFPLFKGNLKLEIFITLCEQGVWKIIQNFGKNVKWFKEEKALKRSFSSFNKKIPLNHSKSTITRLSSLIAASL